jgi:hypothetical protein
MQQREWVVNAREVGVFLPIPKVMNVEAKEMQTNKKHPRCQDYIRQNSILLF